MCWDAIVDLYERHARDFDRDRGRTLQEKAWLDKFLLSHVRPSGVVSVEALAKSADLRLQLIPGLAPESFGWPVATNDEGTDTYGAQLAKPGFRNPHQLLRDASSSIRWMNSKSGHAATPSVPAGNKGCYNSRPIDGHEKQTAISFESALNTANIIGRAGSEARHLPEVEYSL